MKIISEIDLNEFEAWQGGKDTKERIIREGKEKEFSFLIEELYPDGLTEPQLNDILWFEEDWLFEHLGIDEHEDEDEDEGEDEDEN